MSDINNDVNSDSSTEEGNSQNSVPQSRFNEVNEEKKALKQELEALKAKQEVPTNTADLSSLTANDIAKLVKSELKKETREESFFNNLEEGMPTPDMDEVKAYAKKEGLDPVRAYKEMHEDDILDYKLKNRLRKNNGALPVNGQASGSSNFDPEELQKIAKTGNKKAFNEYVKMHGLT